MQRAYSQIYSLCILLTSLGVTADPASPDGNSELIGLGPSSVPAELSEREKLSRSSGTSWPSVPPVDDYNLTLAADYNLLSQSASESLGDKDATGGVFRFFGSWKSGSDSGNSSRFVFKAEHRHALSSDFAPNALLFTAGTAGVSGPTYSDKGAVLTNLYWGQQLLDNKFSYIAGIVDVSDYFDVYGLANVWTDFNNLAFSTNPSSPVPSQGLGVAGRWAFTDKFYVLAGVADINGDPERQEDAFDSFFNTAEYFKHIEIGMVGSWNERLTRNAHITFWQSDERNELGIEEDSGVAVSWSPKWEAWQPFVRGGYAENGTSTLKKTVSAGVGKTLGESGDVLGVGVNWGQTAASNRDQYTTEIYYKWHPVSQLLLIPSIQYVSNPANTDQFDSLWLLGVKVRASF